MTLKADSHMEVQATEAHSNTLCPTKQGNQTINVLPCDGHSYKSSNKEHKYQPTTNETKITSIKPSTTKQGTQVLNELRTVPTNLRNSTNQDKKLAEVNVQEGS